MAKTHDLPGCSDKDRLLAWLMRKSSYTNPYCRLLTKSKCSGAASNRAPTWVNCHPTPGRCICAIWPLTGDAGAPRATLPHALIFAQESHTYRRPPLAISRSFRIENDCQCEQNFWACFILWVYAILNNASDGLRVEAQPDVIKHIDDDHECRLADGCGTFGNP